MASKAELQTAKSAAEGLIKSGVSADEVMQYAEEANKSAEKYQLYCAAFKLYAKEGKADAAADIIKTLQAEFLGVPDKDIVSMIEQNAKKLAKDNAELGAALNISKARAFASQQLSKAKKDLKKSPNSVELKYLVAESYAVLGDWKAALKQFKDAGGTVWQIASDEYSGVISAKTAAFWWDYKPRSKFNADSAFKVHAAELYEKLIKDGELSVLEKATAEKRIEQAEQLGASKPKGEQDKLKKVCNPKGLVHCWQFNGDLKDCVKGVEAAKTGNIKIEGGMLILPGGPHLSNYVDLGSNLFPTDAESITIEMWVRQTKRSLFPLVFCVGNIEKNALKWAANTIPNQPGCLPFWINGRESKCDADNLGFVDGGECHLAVVIKTGRNGEINVTAYNQDGVTGETRHRLSAVYTNAGIKAGELNCEHFNLGASLIDGRQMDGCFVYNEVRIWNRALSEEELTQNAIKFHKAGETMKK